MLKYANFSIYLFSKQHGYQQKVSVEIYKSLTKITKTNISFLTPDKSTLCFTHLVFISQNPITMKTEIKDRINRLRRLKKPLIIVIILLIITTLLSGLNIESSEKYSCSDLWEPLNKVNRSSRDAAHAAAIDKKVENIMEIFRETLPFNPPKGFTVVPHLQFINPITLPGNSHTPEPVHLRFALRMPPQSNDIVAGVNVWINDPFNLLGEPLLSDSKGYIFLLPPDVGIMGGQKIVSRMAHPPGYNNEYPCSSIFPLWSLNQEPFLRSVVRPSFGLAKSTVTTYFTAGNRPFWKPVSQERWINAMIAHAEKMVNDITAGVEAADEINLTEQQVNQMKLYIAQMKELYTEDNIKKNYREAIERLLPVYEMMKQNNPAQAEEFYNQSIGGMEKAMDEQLSLAGENYKEIEKMEQKLISALLQRENVMQQMKVAVEKENWDILDKLADEHNLDNLRLIADAGRSVRRLRAELAALSPAERRAPAFGFLIPDDHPLGTQRQVVAMVFDAERASGLVPANAKGARAIVSINPEFFNFSDNEAPIKLMAIEYWGRNTITYDNNRRNLLNDIWLHLNWQELRAMVR